jgi:hypothetical protein
VGCHAFFAVAATFRSGWLGLGGSSGGSYLVKNAHRVPVDRRSGWYVHGDHAVGSNAGVVADHHLSNDHCSCSDIDSVSEHRSESLRLRVDCAQGDILSDGAIIADGGKPMNDDATLMNDFKAPTNLRCVLNFYTVVIAHVAEEGQIRAPKDPAYRLEP